MSQSKATCHKESPPARIRYPNEPAREGAASARKIRIRIRITCLGLPAAAQHAARRCVFVVLEAVLACLLACSPSAVRRPPTAAVPLLRPMNVLTFTLHTLRVGKRESQVQSEAGRRRRMPAQQCSGCRTALPTCTPARLRARPVGGCKTTLITCRPRPHRSAKRLRN